MTRAWYRVTSTGNQSGEALDRLAEQMGDSCPKAVGPLTCDQYVDDIASGADSHPEREDQVTSAKACLAAGGFSIKLVVRSGEKPPKSASFDGVSLSCLGIRWQTEEDILSPMIGEMNLSRKVRGAKPAAACDVSTPEDIALELSLGLVTKALTLSRIAEFYDPAGWWEPLKLQLKLLFQELVKLDWTEPIPDVLHADWIWAFATLYAAWNAGIPRCMIPASTPPNWKLRLICLADAAEGTGGCAIYSVETSDGSYEPTHEAHRSA